MTLEPNLIHETPPAGTKCFLCWLYLDHFCPARLYWFEVPVCQSCAQGVPCAQQLALEQSNSPNLYWGGDAA